MPVVYVYYPETMGRSLEELETMFSEGESIHGIVRESRKSLKAGLMEGEGRGEGARGEGECQVK